MSQLVLQPDETTAVDAPILSSTLADFNFGNDLLWVVGSSTSGKFFFIEHSLARWDLSSITAGSTITGVTLDLYVNTATSAGAATINRITQTGWTEAGVTWNKYDGTTAWTTAGGDYTATNAEAFTSPTTTGAFTITGSANLIAQAQYAVDSAGGNFHMLLRCDNELSALASQFASSSDTTASRRPKLTIDYTAAAAGGSKFRKTLLSVGF